ncbi:MAG: hypothetical protein MJ071_08900 [Oscillospiraceae bacterium]|nr:hypothetical protein [Oscillospiraceae bacterium]
MSHSRDERILRQIQRWKQKHLRIRTKVNYALTADLLINDGMNSDFRKYIITKEYLYQSETSREFQLFQYGTLVEGWLNQACHLIDVFHERHDMRKKLERYLRDDVLYVQMEQVFYHLMAAFLQMIRFFQYDRITNEEYRESASGKITELMHKAEKLLEYYGSYIALQGASAYSNVSDEIGAIHLAVESMQDACREVSG